MQLNLKEKAQTINQVRVKYFTSKNKPLSLVILFAIFVLFAISYPVIAFFMLVGYGSILVLAIRHGQQDVKPNEGNTINKNIDNKNNE
jgi:hypothetical protein